MQTAHITDHTNYGSINTQLPHSHRPVILQNKTARPMAANCSSWPKWPTKITWPHVQSRQKGVTHHDMLQHEQNWYNITQFSVSSPK